MLWGYCIGTWRENAASSEGESGLNMYRRVSWRLWDFTFQTDYEITARSPDLVVVNKQQQTCQILDVAIPEGMNERAKEEEEGR